MSLVVTRLEIENFRCYDRFSLQLDPRLTLLVGPNAIGKTSLVEALQVTTTTESFRRPTWSELVRWGAVSARTKLHAEGEGRRLLVELDVDENGRREYRVNGKVRRRLLDVAGIIHCVVFTPDDLRLVKDSAEKRRSVLDSLGSQLSPSYHSLRLEYERVVRQRNALLKEDKAEDASLLSLDQLLIDSGARLTESRSRLFARLSSAMKRAHAEVTGGREVESLYLPSWEREGIHSDSEPRAAIENMLAAKRAEERARRTTLVGPHRDEIVFLLEGKDARAFGSQGQQRTIALAWKLAEVMVITDIAGQPPILLLDDVMSELDESRRHALATFVGEAAQTVMTTTNLGYFEDDMVNRAKVIELS